MASAATANLATKTQPSTTATASSAAAASTSTGKQRPAANGVPSKARPQKDNKPSSSPPRDSNTPDKHAHDRLVFLTAHFIGQPAQVTVKTGERFTGIFSGAALDTSESQFLLKMAKSLPQVESDKSNGSTDSPSEYLGYGEDHVLEFKFKDIADLSVADVSTDKNLAKAANGTSSSFKTDTDISGNRSVRERQLRPWEPSAENASEATPDLALNGSKNQPWNQFDANEALFGLKTDYNENFYTTSIDRSNPSYKQRAAAADQIAKRIEGSFTSDAHVAEERNIVDENEDEIDEESRYSGVRRDQPALPSTQNNRYTPPARRAPTANATVPGVPIDPAIISSQLARPDPAGKRSKSPRSPIRMEETLVQSPSEDQLPSESNATTKQPSGQAAGDAKRDPLPIPRPTVQIPSTSRAPDATVNVEHNVLDAFKHFAGDEKMKVQERQRQNQRKEKEVKINDLKKFAANFKLKTVVPQDMLGILAKDKDKQVQIVEKSQRQLDEQTSPSKPNIPTVPADSIPTRPAGQRFDGAPGSSGGPNDRPNLKANRSSQGASTMHAGSRGGMTMPSPRTPGTLGPRLLANQRNFAGQDPRLPPTGPALSTDLPHRGVPSSQSASHTGPKFGQGFNVQAIEFKPNPAANSFMPGSSPPPPSPATSKVSAPSRSGATESFFGRDKPKSAIQKKALSDGFNPVARLKKETDPEKQAKDYAHNGGIPQAYRTPPTWDVTEANKDRSYKDMFPESTVSTESVTPVNGPMPHQHQLPPSLQGPHVMPSVHPPPQASPHHFQNRGGDAHFDDHRMHGGSANSSVMPSPRFQAPLAPQPAPMYAPMQAPFGQAQYPMGQPAPAGMFRYPSGQYGNAQGMPMAPPMMPTHSGGGNMMPVQMQQMAMYHPNQQAMYQPHPGPQVPGAGGFPSPRPGHMMMHQNSQGGQPPPNMMYGGPGQPIPQMYMPQHAPQMGHMRGGAPMQQQHSYGSSPHMQHQFTSHRGAPYGGNMAHQQMMPGPGMQHQVQPPSRPVTHGAEHEDGK